MDVIAHAGELGVSRFGLGVEGYVYCLLSPCCSEDLELLRWTSLDSLPHKCVECGLRYNIEFYDLPGEGISASTCSLEDVSTDGLAYWLAHYFGISKHDIEITVEAGIAD